MLVNECLAGEFAALDGGAVEPVLVQPLVVILCLQCAAFQSFLEFMTSSFVAVGDGMDLSGYGYAWLAKGNVERGGTLPMNEWSLLVLVNEGGKLYFYINGELVSNKAGVPFTPKEVAAPLPFRIGGSEVPNDTWNGAIDEVKIESVARSAVYYKL